MNSASKGATDNMETDIMACFGVKVSEKMTLNSDNMDAPNPRARDEYSSESLPGARMTQSEVPPTANRAKPIITLRDLKKSVSKKTGKRAMRDIKPYAAAMVAPTEILSPRPPCSNGLTAYDFR